MRMVMMKVIMKAEGEDGKSLSDDDNSNGNAESDLVMAITVIINLIR